MLFVEEVDACHAVAAQRTERLRGEAGDLPGNLFNHIARGAIDLMLDEAPNSTGEVPTIVATPTLIPRRSTAAPRTR